MFWLWRRKGIPLFIADGNTFVFGRTRIAFSDALPHGKLDSKQGWVVAVLISDPYESVLITSDVVGPDSDIALNFINENTADLIIIDGPSTYHPKQTKEDTERAFERLFSVNDKRSVIIDHHLLRDLGRKALLKDHGILSEKNTLASLLGLPPLCLENKRSQLYDQSPLDSSFHSRFQLHDILILQRIERVTKTLPHRPKMDNLLKEVFKSSKINNMS